MQQAKHSRGRSGGPGGSRAIHNNVQPTPDDLQRRSERWAETLPRHSSPGPITPQTVMAETTPRGSRKKHCGVQRGPSPGPGKGKRAASSGQGRRNHDATPGHGRSKSRNLDFNKGYQQYQATTGGNCRGAHSPGPSPAAAAGDAAPFEHLAAALVGRDPQPDLVVIISVVQGWALYIQIFTF